jgi:FixJ family two-component response regulator
MRERKLVSVVDDDESIRRSLPGLLRSFGFEVLAFASAEDFLASPSLARTDCLVLDVAMPGMTGPELQLELARLNAAIPIVFITARVDDGLLQQCLERGAVAGLIKPFSPSAIVAAVNDALALD